jgi:hypothetical protein
VLGKVFVVKIDIAGSEDPEEKLFLSALVLFKWR